MTETSTVRPGLGAPPADDILVDVRNLRTSFKVMDGVVPAVDNVSFSLGRGLLAARTGYRKSHHAPTGRGPQHEGFARFAC